MSNPVTLPALVGDDPVTRALGLSTVRSWVVRPEFAEVESPATAFKRVVRDPEFDAAELVAASPARRDS